MRTFEVFFKVNFGANQILHRQRIHKESHPVALNDLIVFRGFFLELETVLEALATAALHEDAQRHIGIFLGGEQFLYLRHAGVRKNQRFGCFFRRGILQLGVLFSHISIFLPKRHGKSNCWPYLGVKVVPL